MTNPTTTTILQNLHKHLTRVNSSLLVRSQIAAKSNRIKRQLPAPRTPVLIVKMVTVSAVKERPNLPSTACKAQPKLPTTTMPSKNARQLTNLPVASNQAYFLYSNRRRHSASSTSYSSSDRENDNRLRQQRATKGLTEHETRSGAAQKREGEERSRSKAGAWRSCERDARGVEVCRAGTEAARRAATWMRRTLLCLPCAHKLLNKKQRSQLRSS